MGRPYRVLHSLWHSLYCRGCVFKETQKASNLMQRWWELIRFTKTNEWIRLFHPKCFLRFQLTSSLLTRSEHFPQKLPATFTSTAPAQRQFTWCKFSHQTKHFCCGSAFLLHDNGVPAPLKLLMLETGFQNANVLKQNLLSGCVNRHNAKPMMGVTTLTAMLAQVNAFRSSYYQTLIKLAMNPKQVEYDNSLLR